MKGRKIEREKKKVKGKMLKKYGTKHLTIGMKPKDVTAGDVVDLKRRFIALRSCYAYNSSHKIKDYQDEPIAEGFYEFEFLKVKHPEMYLVEKVLKRRGNQLYVKWLGFDNTHNSWIDNTDL
ncbi:uncharacterized protein LOC127285417 [Leptopilina boulardi]|uniref:uncharacterized protein LOC127285417 n=1 Tax=Leptopilina boulardi TaxID=63433 RepID=UPI0021F68C7A|nr:uncharacterized protein LOC127285417 [Leptopilina boulardi]